MRYFVPTSKNSTLIFIILKTYTFHIKIPKWNKTSTCMSFYAQSSIITFSNHKRKSLLSFNGASLGISPFYLAKQLTGAIFFLPKRIKWNFFNYIWFKNNMYITIKKGQNFSLTFAFIANMEAKINISG
jgi:hypothetical protein